jgi:hypothetical protein
MRMELLVMRRRRRSLKPMRGRKRMREERRRRLDGRRRVMRRSPRRSREKVTGRVRE